MINFSMVKESGSFNELEGFLQDLATRVRQLNA